MSTITISTRHPISPLQISVSNFELDSTQVITLTGEPQTDPADEPLFGTHIKEAVRAVKDLVR